VRVTLLGIAVGVIIAALVGFLIYFVYAHQDFRTGPF